MGYCVKSIGYGGDDWLIGSLNNSLNRVGGKVWVICKPSESEKIRYVLTEPCNSKLYFVTHADDYAPLIERICSAEMSVCYVSQSLADKIGVKGQRYILTRLRNQGWCSGEIIYFSDSDLAKLQEG